MNLNNEAPSTFIELKNNRKNNFYLWNVYSAKKTPFRYFLWLLILTVYIGKAEYKQGMSRIHHRFTVGGHFTDKRPNDNPLTGLPYFSFRKSKKKTILASTRFLIHEAMKSESS